MSGSRRTADAVLVEAAAGPVVRASRGVGDFEATAEVAVTPDAADPVGDFGRLAAAEAWLLLARSLRDRDDFEEAYQAARQGVVELGEDYTTPSTLDDTPDLLDVSEHFLESGDPSKAASAAVRVLSARCAMFRGSRHERGLSTK